MRRCFLGFWLSCIFVHIEANEKYWKTNTKVLTPNIHVLGRYIGGDEPVMVEFYAPWCGHCKTLKPVYDKVADAFNGFPVKIIAMDCDADKDVAKKYGVKGFPTVLYFPAGSKESEKYEKARDLGTMISWINEHADTNAMETTSYIILDEDNFDDVVMNPDQHVVVNFCEKKSNEECNELKPHFDTAGGSFDGEDITFAYLNAMEYPNLAAKHAESFPNIKLYKKENKKGVLYNGNKKMKDEHLVAFVNEQTGSERLVGGGITKGAGLIPELDELAANFPKKDNKEDLLKAAKEIAEIGDRPMAKVYIEYMEQTISGGVGVLYKESFKLKKLIKKKKGKIVEYHKRMNILKVIKGK